MYVGSIYMDEPVAGDGKRNYRFTDKKRQQEALQFVMKNVYDMPKWLLNKDIIDKIGPVVSVTNLQARVLKSLFAKPVGSVMALKDRKSTRLNSSHANISYAVFCLKKTKHKM